MSNKFDDILLNVAEETFGALAFMMAVPDDDAAEVAGETVTTIVVEFDGPTRGALFVTVSDEIMPEIAENMLGLNFGDDPPTPDQQTDALKELLNVICGNLLPEIAGAEAVFDVSAPAVAEEQDLPRTYRDLPRAAAASVYFDSGRAELALFIAETANIGAGAGRAVEE